MQPSVYLHILVMFAVIYLIRVLPLTLIRKRIRSRFLRCRLFRRCLSRLLLRVRRAFRCSSAISTRISAPVTRLHVSQMPIQWNTMLKPSVILSIIVFLLRHVFLIRASAR